MNIREKVIEEWVKAGDTVTAYKRGIDELKASRIVDLLMYLHAPSSRDGGKDVNVAAAKAHWFEGYTTAFDHILYFIELFTEQTTDGKLPAALFGADDVALKRGLVTREELENYNKRGF